MLLHSCDSCIGVSCKDKANYHEILRIVSARDGSDLVFGASQVYPREKIRFFSVNGVDTTFLEQRALKLTDTAPDSALIVNFSSKSDTAFMQLTPTDIDTFLVTYGEEKAWCCNYNVVSSLRYNNSSDTLSNPLTCYGNSTLAIFPSNYKSPVINATIKTYRL